MAPTTTEDSQSPTTAPPPYRNTADLFSSESHFSFKPVIISVTSKELDVSSSEEARIRGLDKLRESDEKCLKEILVDNDGVEKRRRGRRLFKLFFLVVARRGLQTADAAAATDEDDV